MKKIPRTSFWWNTYVPHYLVTSIPCENLQLNSSSDGLPNLSNDDHFLPRWNLGEHNKYSAIFLLSLRAPLASWYCAKNQSFIWNSRKVVTGELKIAFLRPLFTNYNTTETKFSFLLFDVVIQPPQFCLLWTEYGRGAFTHLWDLAMRPSCARFG